MRVQNARGKLGRLSRHGSAGSEKNKGVRSRRGCVRIHRTEVNKIVAECRSKGTVGKLGEVATVTRRGLTLCGDGDLDVFGGEEDGRGDDEGSMMSEQGSTTTAVSSTAKT
jgi:hypothetical protein